MKCEAMGCNSESVADLKCVCVRARSRWDWNSNDADVCCMNSPATSSASSYVIWGAGTQGRTPDPPLTIANHCANVVAVANTSLPQLLADHFKHRGNQGG